MQKSINSKSYAVFLNLLRETREKAGITQNQLADSLGVTQSFVSKCERGERRVDIAELREFCIALGTTIEKFIKAFERKL